MRHGIKTLFLLFTTSLLLGCSRLPLPSSSTKLYTVAFYNTENLYDPVDAPTTKEDNAYTPTGTYSWNEERYEKKLKQLAKVIGGIGGENGPAAIGLSEVENRKVLEELVQTSPLRKLKYSILYDENPNASGLDIAMLYQPKHFAPTQVKRLQPDASSAAVLQVKGEFRGELVTFYVVQWLQATKNSRAATRAQRENALTLRKQIAAQQAADPNAKVVVMGDFGTTPNTKVLEDALKATGRPDPTYEEELFNTHYVLSVSGIGSHAPRTKLLMHDQILISKPLLNGEEGLQYVRGSAAVYDPNRTKYLFGKYKDTPIPTYSGEVYVGGFSDHFPVFIQLKKKK